MKKFVLIIVGCLLFIGGFCQNSTYKPPLPHMLGHGYNKDSTAEARLEKLEGIGKLKLLKTDTAVLRELSKNSDALEIIPDTAKGIFNIRDFIHYCPEIKRYKFEKAYISDIFVSDLELTFYKGILIEFEFECDGENTQKLEYILCLKYAKPAIKEIDKHFYVSTWSNSKLLVEQWSCSSPKFKVELRNPPAEIMERGKAKAEKLKEKQLQNLKDF